jgi:hypothetical protein
MGLDFDPIRSQTEFPANEKSSASISETGGAINTTSIIENFYLCGINEAS